MAPFMQVTDFFVHKWAGINSIYTSGPCSLDLVFQSLTLNLWRKIKNRGLPKNYFDSLSYCVIGLGDSNYDQFCKMGKSIDKRLSELGGLRICDLQCLDEVDDLDEIVPEKLENLITTLVNL